MCHVALARKTMLSILRRLANQAAIFCAAVFMQCLVAMAALWWALATTCLGHLELACVQAASARAPPLVACLLLLRWPTTGVAEEVAMRCGCKATTACLAPLLVALPACESAVTRRLQQTGMRWKAPTVWLWQEASHILR